ncbi:MAG: dehydrogenase, partial [Pseudonocardiales bacterium]
MRVCDPLVLAALGGSGDWRDGRAVHDLPADVVERVLHDLRWAELMVPTRGAEDTEFRLRQWSSHELWFHERSRSGRQGGSADGFGRTSWAKGSFDPLPARPDPYPGPAIDLPEPDLALLRRTDPTLTAVLEDRRTIRAHDEDNPVSLDQLGELLYRCSRTRGVRDIGGVEYVSRPHPSGGSVYELELYPVVRHAEGLPAGMYHYDSHERQLRLVREASHQSVRRLLRVAKFAMDGSPQVLIVVAARVGRVMWNYEAMAYALILKHVGVLYQTMYCVATAMGLAPCALGGGD